MVRFVSLQEKRNNFFVYEPILVLKRGKFAHVPGASAGHLGLTQQKRNLPDIVKGADAPEFKCTDICTLRGFVSHGAPLPKQRARTSRSFFFLGRALQPSGVPTTRRPTVAPPTLGGSRT